jgi:predicted Zn-dependent protease
MRESTKKRLAGRFRAYPGLFLFIQAFLFNRWFRAGFILLAPLPFALLLMLPKMWRVTPPGFKPVIRINGIDYLQARSLQREARRRFDGNDIAAGVTAWRSAVVNHPGDVASLRQFLQHAQARIEPPEFQNEILPIAMWLLRLTGTNTVDLEIAAPVFMQYGLDQYVLTLLAPRSGTLSNPLRQVYLKALFAEGRMEDFGAYARQADLEKLADQVPELAPYRAAYRAIFGSAEEKRRGMTEIEALLDDPSNRVVATRLHLRVCAVTEDLAGYQASLTRLQDLAKDGVRDHIQVWRLMLAKGRGAEASKLAADFPARPVTAWETLLLAQAYYDLNLRDTALQTLDRFTLEYSFYEQLWVLYGNLLVEAQRWDQLRTLAVKMRANKDLASRLQPLSHYFEGRADVGQSRRMPAERAFAKAASQPIEDYGLAFSIAKNLQRLGYHRFAHDILTPHRDAGRDRLDFWGLTAMIAHGLKDGDLLLQATAEAVRLAPDRADVLNDHAAALLALRQNPEEAMRHTLRVHQRFPNEPAAALNHASALLQNGRPQEAQRLLARLRQPALNESQRLAFQLVQFEVLVQSKRSSEARAVYEKIDTAQLFPREIEHLNRLLDSLPGS